MAKQIVKVQGEVSEEENQDLRKRVKVKGARAVSQGYYKGRIINAGEIFNFDGETRRDGSLPLWIEDPKKKKQEEEDDFSEDIDEHESEDEVSSKKKMSTAEKFAAKAKETVKNSVDKLV